jgi:hypothetical protein
MSNILASAYPNSALSAWTLILIALVTCSALAFWLVMVFRADGKPGVREARLREARQANSYLVTVASPGQRGQDGHSEAAKGQDTTRREAAA